MKRKNYMMPEMMMLGIFTSDNMVPIHNSEEYNGAFSAPKKHDDFMEDEDLNDGEYNENEFSLGIFSLSSDVLSEKNKRKK